MAINEKNTGLDKSIPKIDVIMVKDKAEPYPKYELDCRYKFHYYKPGYEKDWAKIQISVNHLPDYDSAIRQFREEFGNDVNILKNRMLFVAGPNNKLIATAAMWHKIIKDQPIQRLHWIAVKPEHQGRRISHVMLSELFGKFIDKGPFYLTTQTWSYRAISIYCKFGFKAYPYSSIESYFDEDKNYKMEKEELKLGWQIIMDKINESRL